MLRRPLRSYRHYPFLLSCSHRRHPFVSIRILEAPNYQAGLDNCLDINNLSRKHPPRVRNTLIRNMGGREFLVLGFAGQRCRLSGSGLRETLSSGFSTEICRRRGSGRIHATQRRSKGMRPSFPSSLAPTNEDGVCNLLGRGRFSVTGSSSAVPSREVLRSR